MYKPPQNLYTKKKLKKDLTLQIESIILFLNRDNNLKEGLKMKKFDLIRDKVKTVSLNNDMHDLDVAFMLGVFRKETDVSLHKGLITAVQHGELTSEIHGMLNSMKQ